MNKINQTMGFICMCEFENHNVFEGGRGVAAAAEGPAGRPDIAADPELDVVLILNDVWLPAELLGGGLALLGSHGRSGST